MAKNTSSSKGNTRHVVPHPDGWANKKGGAERASSVHSTKKEAEAAARANKASAKVLSLLYMAKTARYNAKIAMVTTQKTLKDRSPYE